MVYVNGVVEGWETRGAVEVESAANVFDGEDPEVINFRDIDVLLDSWLDEELWPE